MPSKLLRVRTATVVALALLAIGAMAAAASGLASASAERATTAAPSRSSGGQVVHEIGDAAARTHGPKAAAATNGSGSDRSRDHVAGPGPDASGAAKHGLCQAWSAGQGDDHGKRADAPPFQSLAAAAGGADQVAAYCRAELDAAARGQQPGAPHGNAPVRKSPSATGPPQDPGQGNGRGNGQGEPPTTT
jgi:hypothetical protein